MPIPILVVDDEPNFLELMKGVLGKKGFDVNTALNPEDALKLLDKEYFDFALLDVKLGAANGLCLLKKIKERQPRVKAVMVTAYPTEESRSEAFQRGASAYLTKPLGLVDLLRTFTAALAH